MLLESFGLCNIISRSTRVSGKVVSVLYCCIVDIAPDIGVSGVIDLGISDHLVQFVSYSFEKRKQVLSESKKFICKRVFTSHSYLINLTSHSQITREMLIGHQFIHRTLLSLN